MHKAKVIMCCSTVSAILLGVYGQGISYYISGNIPWISPVILLSIITFISISLFMLSYILCRRLDRKENKNKHIISYVTINNFIGILVSLNSLFVLLMWWG